MLIQVCLICKLITVPLGCLPTKDSVVVYSLLLLPSGVGVLCWVLNLWCGSLCTF